MSTFVLPTLEEAVPAAELDALKAGIAAETVALFASDVFPKVADMTGYKGTVTPTATVTLKLVAQGDSYTILNDVKIGVDFGGHTYDPMETVQRMIFSAALDRILTKS